MYQKIKVKIKERIVGENTKTILYFQSYNHELGSLDLKETEKIVINFLNNSKIETNLELVERICNSFKYCKKVKLKKYKLTFVFEK